MGAAQFQGFVAADGRVETEQTSAGVVPAGSTVLRGMAVTSAGKVLITQDTGQPRTFMNGIAFERDTGIVLFGNAPPLNISHGGLLVDVNGAVVMTVNAPDVIHQGVGLTNAGELCVEQLGCFFIANAQIGDPFPDQVYITYNEDFDDTTCSVPGDWVFQYSAENFDNVAPQPPISSTIDAWLTENTLESKDGAGPGDAVTLSYTPGTCSKLGDPSCDLKQVTDYPVTNNILGPTSLEIGNLQDDAIVVDYPVDIDVLGTGEYWSVEDTGGPIVGATALLFGDNVVIQLPSDGTDSELYFVTYDPANTSAGTRGVDGRFSYKFFGAFVTNNIDTTPPSVPQNLTATATGQTTIDLSWDPSTDSKSGMKEYVIYRASVEIDRVAHPTTTYQDTGLSPETAYSYTVSAVDNKDNESAQSASDSATTWQPAPLVVSAEVGNVADNIVVVTFDREVVATDYAQGWTFTEDTSPQTISSANKTLATEVQFTLAADISNGTIVAYAYNGTTGNYENTDGVDMVSESGSVTNNVAPPVTDPVFVAFAADTDGWIRVQTVGTGTPAFSRGSGGTVEDFEPLVKEALSGEMRYKNARRAGNILRYTEALDNAWWLKSAASISTGVTDPDGGSTAFTLTASGTGIVYKDLPSEPNGVDYTSSWWIKRRTGTGTVRIVFNQVGSFGVDVTSAVTPSWQRISGTYALPAGQNVRVGIYLGTSGDEVDLWHPIHELVEGQTDQNPSEYVSVDVESTPFHGAFVDGVAYYAHENGNTVSSNVVTEAKGSDLTTDWGALFEPARTNYADGADDLSGGAETVDLTAGGTGEFTLSVRGTAAVTVAAGTATGTGFGQATEGNPVTFNITSTGTVTLTLNSGTLDKVNGLALKQVEKGSNATSFILTDGATGNRTADDGDGMFASSNFDIAEGSFVVDVQMFAEADQGLLNFANAVDGLLSYKSSTKFTTTDGTNTASVDPSLSANLGDVIRVSILYSVGDGLRIGYRNITDAGSWVWDTDSAAFDGSFNSDNVFNVMRGVAVSTVLRDLIYYNVDAGEAFIEANY